MINASYKRGLRIYGSLQSESADVIAGLVINALSLSNYTRMVLIVDDAKRVMLLQERSKFHQEAVKDSGAYMALGASIGPIYRCGRNPARMGLTVQSIAEDILETLA